MPTSIDRHTLARLLDDGAQLLEVLEEGQYRQARLPGAIHVPAWELTARRAEERLDRSRPVVTYCFDTL